MLARQSGLVTGSKLLGESHWEVEADAHKLFAVDPALALRGKAQAHTIRAENKIPGATRRAPPSGTGCVRRAFPSPMARCGKRPGGQTHGTVALPRTCSRRGQEVTLDQATDGVGKVTGRLIQREHGQPFFETHTLELAKCLGPAEATCVWRLAADSYARWLAVGFCI